MLSIHDLDLEVMPTGFCSINFYALLSLFLYISFYKLLAMSFFASQINTCLDPNDMFCTLPFHGCVEKFFAFCTSVMMYLRCSSLL